MNRIRNLMGILIAFLFVVACDLTKGSTPPPEMTSPTPGSSITPSAESTTPVPIYTNTPTSKTPNSPDQGVITRMPEDITPYEFDEDTPIIGEVPEDFLDRILSDLAQKTGVDKQTIRVKRSEAIIWNDGSLGCPKPGEFYTQGLVKGYWVVLEVENQLYDYRAAETGYFFLCEGGSPHIKPQGTPDS